MSSLYRYFVFALFLIFTVNLSAKKVQGVVVDLTDSTPIPDVTLMLVSDSTMKGVAFSDSLGYFWFEVADVDSFYLKTYRTGYVDIEAGAFKLMRLDSMNITVKLEQQAYMLDEIEVTAERLDQLLDHVGFLSRKERLHGTFFSRTDIREKNFTELPSLFRTIPGMKVVNDSFGNRKIVSNRTSNQMGSLGRVSKGADPFGQKKRSSKKGIVSSGDVILYVDGIIVAENSVSFLDSMNLDDIAGIEIYNSPVDAPAQYNNGQYKPVILIWTGGSF